MHLMTPRKLDCAALDREYDNVGKVTPAFFRQLIGQLEAASAQARHMFRAALDIPYGPTSLEQLDIFLPEKKGTPVQVFIHGGYWHALDKRDFSYIAAGLVPHGITAVVINYPLLPTVCMEAQVAACRRALRWVYDHIEEYGGNPERISISGHSAGGHLAAMLLTDAGPEGAHSQAPRLEHACLISGIYDLEPIRNCFVNDVLGLSADEAGRYSPVRLRRAAGCPITVAVGGDEGHEYIRQSARLWDAWSPPDRASSFRILANENHFTLRAQLGEAESDIMKRMLPHHR